MTELLIDRVAALARRRPGMPAIVGVGDSTVSWWTWSKLWRESGRVATLLLGLQVATGEVVGYQLGNCNEFVAVTLGILRLGAICCPLMPFFGAHELQPVLRQAGVRVFFTLEHCQGHRNAEELTTLARAVPSLRHIVVIRTQRAGQSPQYRGRAAHADVVAETPGLSRGWYDTLLARGPVNEGPIRARKPAPSATAQLLFTSGTTGTPKGVLHRQDVLLQAVRMHAAHLGLGPDDRIYVPSPLAHQTGFLYGMWLALYLGVPQILQQRWEGRHGVEALRQWRGTFAQAATPFLIDLLQAVQQGARAPQSLRIFVATGVAVPPAVAHRAAQLLRTSVCGAFGTTEGCLATSASPADPEEKARGSAGRPLGSIRIRVRAEHGAILGPGQEGLLETYSPTMFEGYLDMPESTAQAYSQDGWYRTGDLAVVDADGYLHITGRISDVINRGGEKIPVVEIEQLLHEHEAVCEVAIVAMPDARLIERACAFVATHPGHPFDFQRMQAYLAERRVAKQYWPERLELVDTLPRTASGKIQKNVLRERAAHLHDVDAGERTA